MPEIARPRGDGEGRKAEAILERHKQANERTRRAALVMRVWQGVAMLRKETKKRSSSVCEKRMGSTHARAKPRGHEHHTKPNIHAHVRQDHNTIHQSHIAQVVTEDCDGTRANETISRGLRGSKEQPHGIALRATAQRRACLAVWHSSGHGALDAPVLLGHVVLPRELGALEESPPVQRHELFVAGLGARWKDGMGRTR